MFVIFFTIIGGAVYSQGKFRVYGSILYEGVPVQQARVGISELQMTIRTDANGYFSFVGVPDGTYHLTVNRHNTIFVEQVLRVSGEDVHIDVDLEYATVMIQEVKIETNPFRSGPKEKSLSVQTIQREELDRYASESFVAALERQPGISMINTGVGIAKPVIRGMAFNRVMVNDRGIKQEGQQWGADHGLEIDPYDVERVEVVKGPAALLYGSDAMGGVINIRPPLVMPAGEVRGGLTSLYRSNNDLYALSAFVEGSSSSWFYRVRLTTQDYGNYRVPANSFVYAGFVLPIYDQMLTNTAGRERHGSATLGYRFKKGVSSLTLSRFHQEVGLFPGAVGMPRAYNLQHRGEFRNIDLPNQENTHFKLLSNTSFFVRNSRFELDLGYQRNLRRELSSPHAHGMNPRPEGNLAMELDLHTVTANAKLSRDFGLRWNATLGVQSQYMEHGYSGFEFLVPSYRSYIAGIFGYVEHALQDDLHWNIGGRIDGARHDIQAHFQPVYQFFQPTGEFTQRNPDIDRSFFNWSGATGLSWIYDNNWNAKLNLGSSFRIPTPVELSVNGVHHGNFRHELGNPGLLGERGLQADLNISWKNQVWFMAVTPFVSLYDRYIYLAPSGRFSDLPGSRPFWEYRQNAAQFVGVEFQVERQILSGLHVEASVEYVQNKNLDTGLPLPLTPPLGIFGAFEYERVSGNRFISSWYVRSEIRYAADQNRVDRNELTTAGFTLLNAGIGGVFKFGKQEVDLSLRGTNLTNALYFHHLSRYRLLNLPEQGRNISIMLKMPLARSH